MGRVWRATDVVLHRDVAIKELVPPPGLTAGERQEMRERSLREARAIARLNHVNVVRVFDVLRTDADPWIVMEYVPSRSLQDTLASDGPFQPVRAAEIGLGVLGALRAAHRAGVVHRDVKPGNVLIGADGRVVLTDFGLATVPGDPNVTRTGLVLGSPAYIAPERARDGSAGPAADLWSLGATLYAAVEGASPFARPSAIATLAALATENPPTARNAGPLKPVLNGLLRKDPSHRINAEEAERLLNRAAGRRSRVTFPMSPTMRRPGVGRERPALASPTGSAPVVPGPRPPVVPARPVDPPGRPPASGGRPAAGGGRPPVYVPGKAQVGRPADTPTRVDGPKIDKPHLDATRVDTPPVRDDRFGTRPGSPPPTGQPPANPPARGCGVQGAFAAPPDAAPRGRRPLPPPTDPTALISRVGNPPADPTTVVSGPPVDATTVGDPSTDRATKDKSPAGGIAGERAAASRAAASAAVSKEATAPPATDETPSETATDQSNAAGSAAGAKSATSGAATGAQSETSDSARSAAAPAGAATVASSSGTRVGGKATSDAEGAAQTGESAATGNAAASPPHPASADTEKSDSVADDAAASGVAPGGVASASTPTADRPTADRPTADRPTAGRPTANRPTANTPVADRSTANTPAADKSATGTPAGDESTADKSATAGKAATSDADVDGVAAEQTAAGQAASGRTSKKRKAAAKKAAASPSADETDREGAAGSAGSTGASAGAVDATPAGQVTGAAAGVTDTSTDVAGGAKGKPAAERQDVTDKQDATDKSEMGGEEAVPSQVRVPVGRSASSASTGDGRSGSGAPLDDDDDDASVAPISPMGRSTRPAWQPMEPRPLPSGVTVFGTRLTYRQAAVGAGIVLLVLVLIGTLVVGAFGEEEKEPAGGEPKAVPTAAAGGERPSAGAPAAGPGGGDPQPPTTGPSSPSAAPTTAAAPGAVKLPAGWKWYTGRATGNAPAFVLPIPDGANVSGSGQEMRFRWNNRLLILGRTTSPQADAYDDWKRQEASRRGTYRNYSLLRLARVNYRDYESAADWEFTYTTDDSGNPQRVIRRNFRVDAGAAYSLNWYVSPDDWQASQKDLQLLYQGFQPK
ncbi:hypothetical protein Ari01nite_65660 [Paractinoplanes rishiriensis]|uniref:Protein kinase domain-containing protein n=1 Tax=Paractinoplanes rishiriensis TaxID=1050105 RepID=A0A919K9J8_9ACTN|nr:hypothetical protein Ari01nite_65660 [Actinoplanes rishiriensis]